MTKRILLSAASAFLLASAGAASADVYTPTSEAMTTPTISWAKNKQAAALGTLNAITVVSDGYDYQHALDTQLALPFHIHSQVTKSRWRIKESYIVIGRAPIMSGGQVGACCGSLGIFDQYNYAAYVPHGDTKELQKDGWWTAEVKDNSIATRARNACRNLKLELQQQGLGREEIFGQDRNTTLPTEFHYVARVGHRNHNRDLWESGEVRVHWKQSQAIWQDINVICQRDLTSEIGENPNPGPKPVQPASTDLAVPFQVKQAALAITPKKYEGACPMKLHLNPTIETIGKGTVRYRFVDQLGHKSKEYKVKFDKSDVKFLDHVVEIDRKDKPKGPSLATPQAQQGGQLGLAAPSNPDLVQGYYRLEIVAPHKKLSKIVDYSVKCTTKNASDELAPTPGVTPLVLNPAVVAGLNVQAALADLLVEQVQAVPAQLTKLYVKVTNKGVAASAPTTLRALRWVGPRATGRGTPVPAIQPGQSQTVLAELGGDVAGATQLFLRIDDPNKVKEADENNNGFTVK